MTQKEKAEEITGRYRLIFARQREWISVQDIFRAKKGALMAVDEIIDMLSKYSGMHDQEFIDSDIKYYRGVKSEILLM